MNLVVTAASSPASAELNSYINVSWSVENRGTTPASSRWSDGVYLSTDPVWSIDDVALWFEPIFTQPPGPALTLDNPGSLG